MTGIFEFLLFEIGNWRGANIFCDYLCFYKFYVEWLIKVLHQIVFVLLMNMHNILRLCNVRSCH